MTGRSHNAAVVAINPFLRHLLLDPAPARVSWRGTTLRTYTHTGHTTDVVVNPARAAAWLRRHGFSGLLANWSQHLHGQRFVVEHTSVNPVHPLHLGSLRSSLLGSYLAAVLRSAGAAVTTHYFVNDHGRQVRFLSWILDRADRTRIPATIRFDHAAGVLYALANMFHAHRAGDIARLHTNHPWLHDVVALTPADHAALTRWLADEQPPDSVLVRRMLDAALGDLATVGTTIDVIEHESTLHPAPSLPYDLIRHGPAATVNGTLCLRHRAGLIPLTRPDGTWLYFTRDVLNTRRQSRHAPHVFHVIGHDQDLLQRGLRGLFRHATVEHVSFGTVTGGGRRFSARQNRLMTVADLYQTDRGHSLWRCALAMLTRHRRTPIDVRTSPVTHDLNALIRAHAAAAAGTGIDRHADCAHEAVWPLLMALLRAPEVMHRSLTTRSPHPVMRFAVHTSRLYLRAARHGHIPPWLPEVFVEALAFMTELPAIPLTDLAQHADQPRTEEAV